MKDISQIIVDKSYTLKDALAVLDETGKRILLLVDETGAFQRTITDGDIRRLLLIDKRLGDTLILLESQKSIVLQEKLDSNDILALMDKHQVDEIPFINENNIPIDVYFRSDLQPFINLSIPHMSGEELKYIKQAFDTNWVAPLGPNVDNFEKEIAAYVGSPYAVALSSGTASIHLAIKLLDIKPDDVILCSSFTFVASANPILYEQAIPVFIDSEPRTWNMSPIALERALQEYSHMGKKPKAIIVVHLYGQSADMKKIMRLSKDYDVPVIEDAAESLGAFYQGKHTGIYGKIGVFSFNGNKIITTSGGGMLISKDKELIKRAKFLSTQSKNDAPYYEHNEVGYNYRMSNVLAGIGRAQLVILNQRVRERRSNFEYYQNHLKFECLEWMPEPNGYHSNRWLSVVSLNPEKTIITPTYLINEMLRANVEIRHVWKPMHQQPLFRGSKYYAHSENSFCDYLFETCVCLPSTSSMDDSQRKYIVSKMSEILG